MTITIDLADGLSAMTRAEVIRSRKPDEDILPADDWCPIFVHYAGTTSPKFTDSQIEGIARQGVEHGWCNICDAPLNGEAEAHVKQHLRDLRAWRKRRGAVIDKDRAARLAEARKARKAEKEAEAIAAAPIARAGKGRR